MTKAVFRRIGMTAVPAGNLARDALLSVADGARFSAEIGPDSRSQRSHNHYFAMVNEYWQNLPERLVDEFPTTEHLRKFALIKAGFCHREKFVASSKDEALRIAGFISPMDEYAVIDVTGCVVTRSTALSQSIKAMGGRDFQASKQAVLDVCAQLVGAAIETPRAA